MALALGSRAWFANSILIRCSEPQREAPEPLSAFPWNMRIRLAHDVAKGLACLHSLNPPLMHRDVRSPNIFVRAVMRTNHVSMAQQLSCLTHARAQLLQPMSANAEVVAKIADFGLARLASAPFGGTLLTWRWMAPEALRDTRRGYDYRIDTFRYVSECECTYF